MRAVSHSQCGICRRQPREQSRTVSLVFVGDIMRAVSHSQCGICRRQSREQSHTVSLVFVGDNHESSLTQSVWYL